MNASHANRGIYSRQFGAGMGQTATFPLLDKARGRLKFIAFIFMLAYMLLIGQLFDVMILNPDRGRSYTGEIPPAVSRADIVDRNGELLATSLRVASLAADPALIMDEKETLTKLKAVFPDLDTKALSKDFHSGTRFTWIKRHISPIEQQAVNNLGLSGLEFKPEFLRIYPKSRLTAHIVGFTNIDQKGIAGLENFMNDDLEKRQTPLTLSLDIRLQGIMRETLLDAIKTFNAVGAAGIMLDVNTGEILASVSLPDFDPANPSQASADARFNRATLGTYEMGSTFKTFAIAEALDKGLITLSDHFNCINPIQIGRFKISDFHPEKRWMNVPEIYLHSSNIGAVKIAEKFGSAAQKEFFSKIGLLTASPIEISEVGKPQIPNPWRDINMMTISFGHGIAVNALQLASATAAMINGGVYYPPTMLKRDGPPETGRRVIQERTSEKIRALMRAVVTEGTGKMANAKGYVVGGKTGTADKNQGNGYNRNSRLSSFIAAFPIHKPKYLIYVMIDEPKGTKETYGFATGGWTAAPAIAKIISQSAPLLHVMPYDETDPAVTERLALPVAVK